VLRLDLIDKRSDVFVDVLYDLCVVLLRKHEKDPQPSLASSALLRMDGTRIDLGQLDLPARANTRIWALPEVDGRAALFRPGLVKLSDYGYRAKAGYFVWNREQHRYRVGSKPRPTEVPLFWAHNIRAGKACVPQDGIDARVGFVRIDRAAPYIVRSDAILLQRTSNRGQKRRLIAAPVRRAKVIGGRGFVSENHTIVIIPDPSQRRQLPVGMLAKLLNTAAVDARFRRMSGSVSVSTIGLRELPLPQPADVRAAFSRGLTDEDAAAAAYQASESRGARVARTKSKAARRRP
jgi:adenine-specific DNA-methyltransferase